MSSRSKTLLKVVTVVVGAAIIFTISYYLAEPAPQDGARDDGGDRQLSVYSSRQSDLLQPILKRFTETTGIEIELLSGKGDALIERLAREGESSPADVLITTDVARLVRAAGKGLLAPLDSAIAAEVVPAHLRDSQGRWVGLSLRSRVIAYNPGRVDAASIDSYLDLAEERFRGRVCMRSSNNEYNQSLLAAIVHHHGKAAALEWARGVVANLVQHPQGNDRSQLDLIATGACDLSLVNSYYMGLWLLDPANARREFQPKLLFPEQAEGKPGAHINVSGGGIVASSGRQGSALRLLEFLLSQEIQQVYAQGNQEYPIRADAMPSDLTLSLGWPIRFDDINARTLGELNAEAVRVFDQAGWR